MAESVFGTVLRCRTDMHVETHTKRVLLADLFTVFENGHDDVLI
jgi:hypothetical protein